MKKTTSRYRRQFWHWHRRTGLLSAGVLIVLCITGVVLNHSAHLALDQTSVRAPWVLKAYGINVPVFKGLVLRDHWLTQVGSMLYWHDQALGGCEGNLLGAFEGDQFWWVACSGSIVLFNQANERVESIDANLGLPTPISAAGFCGTEFCIHASAAYLVDLNALQWQPTALPLHAKALQPLPAALQAHYQLLYVGDNLTWERVFLDLHAGRFLGAPGPWILDAFVAIFLFLSASGFYLWYSAKKSKNTVTIQ